MLPPGSDSGCRPLLSQATVAADVAGVSLKTTARRIAQDAVDHVGGRV